MSHNYYPKKGGNGSDGFAVLQTTITTTSKSLSWKRDCGAKNGFGLPLCIGEHPWVCDHVSHGRVRGTICLRTGEISHSRSSTFERGPEWESSLFWTYSAHEILSLSSSAAVATNSRSCIDLYGSRSNQQLQNLSILSAVWAYTYVFMLYRQMEATSARNLFTIDFELVPATAQSFQANELFIYLPLFTCISRKKTQLLLFSFQQQDLLFIRRMRYAFLWNRVKSISNYLRHNFFYISDCFYSPY